MRKNLIATLLIGLLALGALAVAGCGDDDSTATDSAGTIATTPVEGDAAGGASPDDVYNDCTAAVAGTPAESTGETACGQARDVFQKCIDTAAQLDGDAKEQALAACQSAADQTIERLSGQ